MERATSGLPGEGGSGLPPTFDPSVAGPLDRATAVALLRQADDLLEAGEPAQALGRYARVIGQADRDVSAAALFGLGNALYRLDRDEEALSTWAQAAGLGETPVAYRAWRQLAAGRVRAGDLSGAIDAYRQAERRAPREDRPEIASRLGWLSKETGNRRAAGRYFARSRGDGLPPFMTYLIIAVTVIVSVAAFQPGQAGAQLTGYLELSRRPIASGEYWRLITVTLVHANYLHLFFNMYALWFVGIMVEKLYGPWLLALFYVLCGVAASVASFVFGSDIPSVGASGAIFGLFGVALATTRVHHPMLDAQSRAISAQIGALIVLNLIIGFSGMLPIDNFAHVGGLISGLWLGFLLPPGQVATLASFWQRRGVRRPAEVRALRLAGVAALVVVIGVGIVVGTSIWQPRPQLPPGSTAVREASGVGYTSAAAPALSWPLDAVPLPG